MPDRGASPSPTAAGAIRRRCCTPRCVAAQPLGVEVLALHVHHGLSPHADAWLAHCERQCGRWARRGLPVRLHVARLDGAPERGESVEAWARQERYRALRRMAMEQGATPCCSRTTGATRPRPCCSRPCAAAASPGWRACRATSSATASPGCGPGWTTTAQAIEAYVRRHRLQPHRRRQQRRPALRAQPPATGRSGRRSSAAFPQARGDARRHAQPGPSRRRRAWTTGRARPGRRWPTRAACDVAALAVAEPAAAQQRAARLAARAARPARAGEPGRAPARRTGLGAAGRLAGRGRASCAATAAGWHGTPAPAQAVTTVGTRDDLSVRRAGRYRAAGLGRGAARRAGARRRRAARLAGRAWTCARAAAASSSRRASAGRRAA